MPSLKRTLPERCARRVHTALGHDLLPTQASGTFLLLVGFSQWTFYDAVSPAPLSPPYPSLREFCGGGGGGGGGIVVVVVAVAVAVITLIVVAVT